MILNEENYMLFVARAYNNPSCSGMEEFNSDLAGIMHLKKILTKYNSSGEIKSRLAINHIISLYNIFEFIPITQVLFFKIPSKNHSILRTFLKYLDRNPDFLPLYGDLNIKDIPIDGELLEKLNKELI
jgi:hypothetical protein